MSRDPMDEPRGYASPVCYAHEFDVPPLTLDEVAVRLNDLLEGERAGARGLIDMKAGRDDELGRLLDAVARDEARFCAMLSHHLTRLGYAPSHETGEFYDKLARREDLDAKLRLLDRGQSAVVRLLDELMPSVDDSRLLADLREMRDVHVRNLEKCAAYLAD
ncbi:MAG: DUF6306 domain-containing protein [Pseudomonadales bacterium]